MSAHVHHHTNLVQAVQSTIRHNPKRPAFIESHRTFTWAEFSERVAALAGVLLSLGIAAGSRFAIVSRNGFRVEELKWAGFWIGAIPVIVNWRLAPPEIETILTDATCERVFVEGEFSGVFSDPSLLAWTDKIEIFGDAGGADAEAYENRIAQARPASPTYCDPDQDAILFYTGGTTGRSKGVRLSHSNILSNALAFGLGVGAQRHHVYLHAAPMFHSADLLALPWFLQGSPQCYLPSFSPAAFLGAIEQYRVGATVTVPTMLIAAVSHPAFARTDLSSLEVLIYGAAPMSTEWIEHIASAFPGVAFSNCYGLTESAPDLTIFDAREFRASINQARESGAYDGPLLSVGKPNLLNEIRILDPEGRELPQGMKGEIAARGPNIMKGYLNAREQTNAVLRDGWLRTGDVGYIDEQGYVYVIDRLKDVIISGGEKVYSSEVEAVLQRNPKIAEAAVIGSPDAYYGETVVAVIVLVRDATCSEEELSAYCRQWLGGFKIPKRYFFVQSLPKSPLGKVLKSSLRTQFSGASDRQHDLVKA